MCYTHFSCILVCCLTFAFKINLVISFFLFLKIGILNFKTMWIYLDFGSILGEAVFGTPVKVKPQKEKVDAFHSFDLPR